MHQNTQATNCFPFLSSAFLPSRSLSFSLLFLAARSRTAQRVSMLGNAVSSSAWFGAEPQPKSNFVQLWPQHMRSGGNNFHYFRKSSISICNQNNWRQAIGGLCLLSPLVQAYAYATDRIRNHTLVTSKRMHPGLQGPLGHFLNVFL